MSTNTKEIYNQLMDALRAKASEILPKGSQVALFGSRARGDARPDSDWDLHILIPGEERLPWSNWDIYAWPFEKIGMEFDAVVNPRLYSFTGWMKRSFLPFYKNVEKDSVIIFKN